MSELDKLKSLEKHGLLTTDHYKKAIKKTTSPSTMSWLIGKPEIGYDDYKHHIPTGEDAKANNWKWHDGMKLYGNEKTPVDRILHDYHNAPHEAAKRHIAYQASSNPNLKYEHVKQFEPGMDQVNILSKSPSLSVSDLHTAIKEYPEHYRSITRGLSSMRQPQFARDLMHSDHENWKDGHLLLKAKGRNTPEDDKFHNDREGDELLKALS